MDLADFGQDEADALARWLHSRTRLSGQQIAAWTGFGHDAQPTDGPVISPVNQRLLRRPEIERCESDPNARLERSIDVFAEPVLMRGECPAEAREARFHVARLAALNFLTNARNAWHSTWINQYGGRALAGREAILRDRAEKQRVQGSVFKIDRLPAIVLQSDTLTLLGVEVNPSDQLSRFSDVFSVPFTAGQIFDAYASARPNSVIWLSADGNYRYPRWTEGRRLTSLSRGTGFYLDWRGSQSSIAPSGDLRSTLRRARRSIRRGLST